MVARFALALLLGLQRLNVLSLTLDSSTATPRVEQPFEITVTVRIGQNIPKIDNLFLPNVGRAEEIGDERSLAAGPAGSTYRETLRLIAHEGGPLDISSAYLDVIDARDGKAKRYTTNPLHLNVQGVPAAPAPANTLLWIWAGVFGLLSAIAVVTFVFVRGMQRPHLDAAAVITPAPAAPESSPPAIDPYDAAIARLRSERSRAAVLYLRNELWHMAGAADGATLADVLAMPVAANPRTRAMLQRVERAAFIDDDRLQQAISEILA